MSEQPQKRLPYHQDLQVRSRAFLETALEEVPELESMAVVFGYSINTTELPFAMVMGQSGPLQNPIEIVHMCQQLWRTLAYQLENGQQVIRNVDDYMKQQADKLQELQAQIAAAEQRLEELQAGNGKT